MDIRKFDLQFFGEGEGDTGAEGGQQQQKQDEGKSNSKQLFTQEQVDEIVKNRLERERKKYADYEELKKLVEEYKKREEEDKRKEMNELERLQADFEKLRVERDDFAKKYQELENLVKQERIKNAFILEAQKQGVKYIDDAYRLADLSGVELTDSGQVVGVDKVIEALKESKPYLFEQQQNKPVGTGTNPSPNGTAVDINSLSPIQLLKMGYASRK